MRTLKIAVGFAFYLIAIVTPMLAAVSWLVDADRLTRMDYATIVVLCVIAWKLGGGMMTIKVEGD